MNQILVVVMLLVAAFGIGYLVATLKGPTINPEIGRIEHKGKLYFDSTIHRVELFGKKIEQEAAAKVPWHKVPTATAPSADASANGQGQSPPPAV